MIYIAAIALGALRWPWWSLALALGVNFLWKWLVELPHLNNLLAGVDRTPSSIWDEPVLIALGMSMFGAIVAYVVASALSTLIFGARKGPQKAP